MMELIINGNPGIKVTDENKVVISDKRIAKELSTIKDINGNEIEFTNENQD